MSHSEKSDLWRRFKESGVKPAKRYQDYTTAELREALAGVTQQVEPADEQWSVTADAGPQASARQEEPLPVDTTALPPADPKASSTESRAFAMIHEARQRAAREANAAPTAEEAPAKDQHAGLRQNTHMRDQPIRTDPKTGIIWYQDEVLKPAVPKERVRRVKEYVDPGARTVSTVTGDYKETFEVAGNESRPAQVRITLPSYQVGIYKDPRFPFRIHTYNGARGFDLEDVRAFYLGGDLVPPSIKIVYVANSMCYDIRTTIQAIEKEYRDRILLGDTTHALTR